MLSGGKYPILSHEVSIAVGVLAVVSATFATIHIYSGRTVRLLLELTLLLVALDWNFDGLAVPAGFLVALLFLRHEIAFLTITSLVILVTGLPYATYSGRGAVPAALVSGKAELPPLVHVIFDGHLGVEGFIRNAEARETGNAVRDFYKSNGFHVSGAAFSEHFRTVNAIPQFLNYGVEQPWTEETSKEGSSVKTNAYFDDLKRRGYAINVYQNEYLNYCEHPAVSTCWQWPQSHLLSIASAHLSPFDRAVLLLQHDLRNSNIVVLAAGIFTKVTGLGSGIEVSRAPHAASAIEMLETVSGHLKNLPGGTAIFIHAMAPHAPYFLRRDCTQKPVKSWLFRYDVISAQATEEQREAAYVEQLFCIQTYQQRIADAAGPDVIVIFNGDHGSRISMFDPEIGSVEQMSDVDLIASYSTLFAVRAPKLAAGYDAKPLQIGQLLRELVTSDFKSASPAMPAGFIPEVVIEDADWKPRTRHALPANWPAPKVDGKAPALIVGAGLAHSR